MTARRTKGKGLWINGACSTLFWLTQSTTSQQLEDKQNNNMLKWLHHTDLCWSFMWDTWNVLWVLFGLLKSFLHRICNSLGFSCAVVPLNAALFWCFMSNFLGVWCRAQWLLWKHGWPTLSAVPELLLCRQINPWNCCCWANVLLELWLLLYVDTM